MGFEAIVADALPCSHQRLTSWGSTLVVAPHPDDESLGCGGAIALLRQYHQPVYVLFVSDGTMSHPHSRRYPPDARRTLREREAQRALAILGVPSTNITYLRLPDTRVPLPPPALPSIESADPFRTAVGTLRRHLQRMAPRTILVPWRRDPHGDHRATWHLCRAVVDNYSGPVRWLEYPVWVWEATDPADLPTSAEGPWCKLNVSSVLDQKQRAIAAHVSQTTSLIDDDPTGFTLSPAMISHFTQPHEYYLEP